MAKRSKRMKRLEPAVLTVTTTTPPVASGATGQFTCDLSQMASLINRRFYRQGLNWMVGGFKFITVPNAQGQITVQKLPNTWVTSGAWNKTMNAWNDQQLEAIEDMGGESGLAAFRDYKVYADATHLAAGYGSNLLPQDGAGAAYAPGEWEPSQIVIPNDGAPGATVEYFVQMVGPSAGTAKGAIAGYEFSRAYPQDPDPQTPAMQTSWLNRMNDVGDNNDDIVDNAINRNDSLPYPQAGYPGGGAQAPTLQFHDITGVRGTTIGGVSRAKGGNFPCGLVRIIYTNQADAAQAVTIQIDLVPGTHRGYMAEPMQEM